MKTLSAFLIVAGISTLISTAAPTSTAAAESNSQITILYDAFGADPSMTKDWGFSALVEVAGKQILFDTGNDANIFAANVKAKGVDRQNSRFRSPVTPAFGPHGRLELCSERQSDREDLRAERRIRHLRFVTSLELLPKRIETLPPEMRYYGGAPPQVMKFGAAWGGANFELIDKTTEIAPGMTLIALVSDAPGTRELKELSLAVNTSEGIVLVVGCSASRHRKDCGGSGSYQSQNSSDCRRFPPRCRSRRCYRKGGGGSKRYLQSRKYCAGPLHRASRRSQR